QLVRAELDLRRDLARQHKAWLCDGAWRAVRREQKGVIEVRGAAVLPTEEPIEQPALAQPHRLHQLGVNLLPAARRVAALLDLRRLLGRRRCLAAAAGLEDRQRLCGTRLAPIEPGERGTRAVERDAVNMRISWVGWGRLDLNDGQLFCLAQESAHGLAGLF